MTNPPKLWLVSPVYLDVESFLMLRDQIFAVLPELPGGPFTEVKLVAVDDSGGLDPEIDRLRRLADVTVIEPPFNLGHQRALVFALRSLADQIADHDYVVTLDADGQDRPADLPRLLAPLLHQPADWRRVALALRTQRQESMPFKVLYFFYRILFRTLVGIVVRTGNFAAYRGWVARRLLFHPHFDLCYSSCFISLNLALDFVPAARGARLAGRSRMSYSRLLMHGVRMLLPFTDRIAVRALVGFAVVFGLGVLGLVASLGSRLAGATLPGWVAVASLLAVILSFVAVGNLSILFTAFAQSRGTSLKNLEREYRERSGSPRSAAD